MLDLVKVRRSFHRIPEPGFEEYKTQELILDYLQQLPQERLSIKTWETGVLVKIHGENPEKVIGYRCDIDGLPITEQTGYDFSSQHEGYMHACGHDFHTTIGLGVVSQLIESVLKDDVIVIFQPAEEGPGGALPMLNSEEFKAWQPDMIFGLHIAPEYPTGTIAVKEGLLFANTSELFIDFHGTGGHAAFPHQANDMVVAASAFVTQIQSIVSRRLDPLDSGVITIGKIIGGEKQNIIAEKAKVEGTMRTTSPEAMTALKKHVEAHVKGIEASYDCVASVDYGANYYQVYNHSAPTRRFVDYCQNQQADLVECREAMTGEDFGYFLKEIPGFMFWLGVNSATGLHTATLKPEEEALASGVDIVSGFIHSEAK